ncbi:MAG TPA: hypothetical protein DEF07_04875 [Nitrosomonas sp.]|nr:hypothetical protein [Nitrosomonas sp.]
MRAENEKICFTIHGYPIAAKAINYGFLNKVLAFTQPILYKAHSFCSDKNTSVITVSRLLNIYLRCCCGVENNLNTHLSDRNFTFLLIFIWHSLLQICFSTVC